MDWPRISPSSTPFSSLARVFAIRIWLPDGMALTMMPSAKALAMEALCRSWLSPIAIVARPGTVTGWPGVGMLHVLRRLAGRLERDAAEPIEVSVNVLKPFLWNAFDTESTAVICSLPRPLSARTTRATWALEMLAVSPPRWRVVRRVVTFSARAVPPRSSSATKLRLDFPALLVQPSAW